MVADGDSTVVRLFLIAGMNPNVGDENGTTVLMLAASRGHIAVVKALLDKGADVNAKNKDGMTTLKVAIEQGHTAIINMIRKAGDRE